MDVGSDKRTVEELEEIRVYLPSAVFDLTEEGCYAYRADVEDARVYLIPPAHQYSTSWWCSITCNNNKRRRAPGKSHRSAFRDAVQVALLNNWGTDGETYQLLRLHAIRSMV